MHPKVNTSRDTEQIDKKCENGIQNGVKNDDFLMFFWKRRFWKICIGAAVGAWFWRFWEAKMWRKIDFKIIEKMTCKKRWNLMKNEPQNGGKMRAESRKRRNKWGPWGYFWWKIDKKCIQKSIHAGTPNKFIKNAKIASKMESKMMIF